jgi:Holliday junction resolvase RusA-like endonuclease
MPCFSFTVEGKPQGKGRPRSTVRGGFARHYTPAKTVAYEKLTAFRAREAYDGPIHLGPVKLGIEMVIPWPASTSKAKRAVQSYAPVKPDIDNVVKAICDGLNGVIYKDDAQVIRCIATKKRGDDKGYVRVYVLLMDSDEIVGGDNG